MKKAIIDRRSLVKTFWLAKHDNDKHYNVSSAKFRQNYAFVTSGLSSICDDLMPGSLSTDTRGVKEVAPRPIRVKLPISRSLYLITIVNHQIPSVIDTFHDLVQLYYKLPLKYPFWGYFVNFWVLAQSNTNTMAEMSKQATFIAIIFSPYAKRLY